MDRTIRLEELRRERAMAAALLRSIEQRMEELTYRERELPLLAAEAEERGDWRMAARLRLERAG